MTKIMKIDEMSSFQHRHINHDKLVKLLDEFELQLSKNNIFIADDDFDKYDKLFNDFVNQYIEGNDNPQVKKDIDNHANDVMSLYNAFKNTNNGKEPDCVICEIQWNDTKQKEDVTIALIDTIDHPNDENVFYSCVNGIDEFEKLAKDGNGEFTITNLYGFDFL